MSIRRIFNMSAIILLCAFTAQAQDRLVEVNVKGTALISTLSSINDFYSNNTYVDIGYAIEAMYFIKPSIAIGTFFTKSIYGENTSMGESNVFQNEGDLRGGFDFLQYGFSGKITTKRNRLFHAYGTIRIFYMEVVHDFEDDFGFSIGENGLAAGIGSGVVIKISKSVGFNILELNYNQFISGFDFTKTNFGSSGFQARSGIVINIKERK